METSLIDVVDDNNSRLYGFEQGSMTGPDSKLAANIEKVEIDRGGRAILDPGDFPGSLAPVAPHQGLYFFHCQMDRRYIPPPVGCGTGKRVER
jgi:hypothetical protein